MNVERVEALVVGAGPAGLMAAEALAESGASVLVAEAKPSPARKLLMAGKSGLNLTKDEPPADFLAAYGQAQDWLGPALSDFGPAEIRAWAEALGQACFTGTSGRVFPVAMKASPLLRAWLARLVEAGVPLRTNWRWLGWEAGRALFATPDGERRVEARATVLAMGGASWARLGSDGHWASTLAAAGVRVAPFQPANMGFEVDWSPVMERHHGAPVKPLGLAAGGHRVRGEIVVTRRGIEGGGVYSLSAHLRQQGAGAVLVLDLLPDLAEPEIARRLSRPRGKQSLANYLRRTLRLPPVKVALLRHSSRELPPDPPGLARLVKSMPLALRGPGPLDAAISTAGGIHPDGLDAGLMLRSLPGVFAAGEMLDWEAPTGGYLLTACLATGRHAGRAAAMWLGRGSCPGSHSGSPAGEPSAAREDRALTEDRPTGSAGIRE